MRVFLLVVLVAACGSHSGSADDGGATGDTFDGPYPDFPDQPIIDPGAPSGAPGLFGDPASGAASGGPCLVEPEVGTLYPRNWLRPRFTWIPTGAENLFELRLTAGNQINPLVVYTTQTSWTMPAAIWTALAAHTVDQPIALSIRGAVYSGSTLTSGPEHGSAGNIAIAPVEAPGAIVYWTTSAGTVLRGFHIGDETVTDVIHPADASTACVGCHSSTPDGMYVGFSASPVAGNGDPATLGMLSADGMHTAPTFVSASAATLMARQNQELPVFSKLHWAPGDHVALTMYQSAIMWTDLEAGSTAQGTGWDFLPRVGETNGAAYASFAHTADTVLYVSAPTVSSGVTVSAGDIATVPYNNRMGGTPTKVLGADTTMYNEYYPTFSPDDKYIAYNRALPASGNSYANNQAEVFAITAGGGTPIRLAANDPPACSGRTSPGVQNSWPKWAPEARDSGSKRYYWLTFSSTRGAGGGPQLYVTPLVEDGATLTTFPALYLWNQPAADHNHTPAWDNFGILQ